MRPGHVAAEHFGLEPQLVGAANDADAVAGIGRDQDHIGVGRLQGADDRREIGRVQRVGLVIDDLQTGFLGVLPRAVAAVARRLAVAGRDRDRLQPELVLVRLDEIEKAPGDRAPRIGSDRQHREVVRIVELLVDIEREQADECLFVPDHDRHRRRRDIRAIARYDEIDLVDIEQLCVDAGHLRRIGLIVIIDELDRAAEQPALGVDVVLPDFRGQEAALAVDRERAGQRHRKPDRDRLAARRLGGSWAKEEAANNSPAASAPATLPSRRHCRPVTMNIPEYVSALPQAAEGGGAYQPRAAAALRHRNLRWRKPPGSMPGSRRYRSIARRSIARRRRGIIRGPYIRGKALSPPRAA